MGISTRRRRTLVLFKALRFSDLVEDHHLFDDLVIQLKDVLTAHICRSVAFEQFELSPDCLELVKNGLFLRIQRDPRQRRVRHCAVQIVMGRSEMVLVATMQDVSRLECALLKNAMCQWTDSEAPSSLHGGEAADVTQALAGTGLRGSQVT